MDCRLRLTVFAIALCSATPAAAQDALRGKRVYLDTARVVNASVSCVDCHRALPPGLFGIGRAANNPAIVANALSTIPQMTPLRGRLSAQDIADVAAYIGNPGVPSPTLRVSAQSPAGTESGDRLDFGAILPSQTSARGTVRLANDGALPLQLTSNVRIVGPSMAEYALVDSSCTATATLAAGQSCEIGITFRPAPGSAGMRSAAVQVDHDWVGGTAAIALLGTAETAAANPPVGSSGGGGALGGWLLILIAASVRYRPLNSGVTSTA
jgi:cytochrome c553